MKVTKINNLTTIFNHDKKPLIAIWGFFDGWHLGHQALLQQLKALAKEHNYQTLVVSFDVKPQSFLAEKDEAILLSNEDKQAFLVQQKIDFYCELQFSTIAEQPAATFVKWLTANNVQAVVSAKDVHFGAKGQGNLATLQSSSLKVFLSEDVYDEHHNKISSSYIKDLIGNKDINHACKLLNASGYVVVGKVVDGIKEGRTLGFPTANLELTANYVVPGVGVYISETEVAGQWHQSMTVVILRYGKLLVESYLLNFNQDLYGKVIKVKFLNFLRDHTAFSSKENLIAQIKQDEQATIAYFKQKASN